MIDGASHVQIFFRIILPLVTPILAVCGLLVFVGVIGEFLLASHLPDRQQQEDARHRALRPHRRRPLQQPGRLRGRGAADRASRWCCCSCSSSVHRRRHHRGRRQGVTSTACQRPTRSTRTTTAPRSTARRPTRTRGRASPLRVRVPARRRRRAGRRPRRAALGPRRRAARPRGPSRTASTRPAPGGVADLDVHNPVTSYRFLLAERPVATTAGSTRRACTTATSPTPRDFRISTEHRLPDWVRRPGRLPGLPRPVRAHRDRRAAARLGTPGRLGRPGRAPGARTSPYQLYGGTLDGITAAPRPPGRPRRDAALPDPGLRGVGPTTATTPSRSTASTRCSAATRRSRRLIDAAHARGLRVVGDLTTNHTGDRPRLVRAGPQRDPDQRRARLLPVRRRRARLRRVARHRLACPSSTTPVGRAAPAACTTARTRSWPAGCARASTAGASTSPT